MSRLFSILVCISNTHSLDVMRVRLLLICTQSYQMHSCIHCISSGSVNSLNVRLSSRCWLTWSPAGTYLLALGCVFVSLPLSLTFPLFWQSCLPGYLNIIGRKAAERWAPCQVRLNALICIFGVDTVMRTWSLEARGREPVFMCGSSLFLLVVLFL